jgi:hypothetical protein
VFFDVLGLMLIESQEPSIEEIIDFLHHYCILLMSAVCDDCSNLPMVEIMAKN